MRTGFTTGYCAAAAAKAATADLLSSGLPMAEHFIQKDAGDDPDITHGVQVFATVSKTNTGCIDIDGGEGVGRVTKPGLKVAVGNAAINPVPMDMIRSAVEEVCTAFNYTQGIKVVISIPGGEEIAKKTMNPRLGIIGGLSVLGTTGIVEPMSNKAIVETIQTEIDVQMACGETKLLITPGNYGRDFAEKQLGIDIQKAIKCSNFIGETLDYAHAKGVKNITLIGHAGKLVKLAGGIMNTHSSIADCRMEIIAAHCALCSVQSADITQIMECITTEAAIDLMNQLGVNQKVWESIGNKIGFHLTQRTRGDITIEYIVFTQEHGVLVHSKGGCNI